MIRSTEEILGDVRKVVAGLDALVAEAADRAEDRIEGGARSAAKAAGELVGTNPWASLATVAGVAFLAGVAISRRDWKFGRRRRNGASGDEWLDTSG